MPKAQRHCHEIKHVWDDESSETFSVMRGSDSNFDPFVSIARDGENVILFRPESWPFIRQYVDELMSDIAEDSRG